MDEIAERLLAMLEKLSNECNGEKLGTLKAPSWATACEAAQLIYEVKHGRD